MNIREEIKEVQNESKEIRKEQETWFLDISHTFKVNQQRFFFMWLLTFIAFIVLLGYTIYLHNDIGTETTTEEYEVKQDGGNNGTNNFVNGNGNEVNNGETND